MDEIFGELPELGQAGEFGEFNEFGELNEFAEMFGLGELGELGELGGSGEALEQWAESLGEMPYSATPSVTAAMSCADTTYGNRPWKVTRPGRHDTPQGTATASRVVRRAEVRELDLSDFDVDDYRLRPAHRRSLEKLVAAVARGLQRRRIGGPVIVRVFGHASSTATMKHNQQLSVHRAWNTRSVLECMFARAGVGNHVEVRWIPVGESLGQQRSGDNVERGAERSVRVQVIAPKAPCTCGGTGPPPVGPPRNRRQPVYTGGTVPPLGRRPMPPVGPGPGRPAIGRRTAQLCLTVLSVKRSPGPSLGGVGVSPSVVVRLRVDDHRSNQSAIYRLRGVAVQVPGSPTSSPRRAAGLPGLAGLFPATLARFAPSVGRLIQQALRALASQACQPVAAVATGVNPLRLLSGMAMLVVPGGGVGRVLLAVKPSSPRLRMRSRVIPARWRGRTPRRHVIVIGTLTLVGVRPGSHRVRGKAQESEFGEFGEGEFGEGEFGEGEFGELGEGEFGEFGEGEFGEDELGEEEFSEFGEGEFGELGEDELGELGEDEFGEFGEDEFGELGEDEFGELGEDEFSELGEDEFGELGEDEFGEFGEDEFGEDELVGEHVW